MPGEVIHSHHRAAEHPVQVQHAAQVVDLVLQDAGIPAIGFDAHGVAFMIEAVDAGMQGAGDYRR